MIEVTVENFEAEVLAASTQMPVLVDFWAPWCGPCRTLGPILEQLEQEYQGRFKLVKINSDEEQQLAGAFGIRSIPTCVLLKDGQPVDGFTGALPAGAVREFLDKHVPSESALAAEADAGQAGELLQSGNTEGARAKLEQALAQDPANDEVRAQYVRLLISAGDHEPARAALQEPLAREPRPLSFDALARWLDAREFAASDAHGSWTAQQFDEAIAQDRLNFNLRFAKARVLMAAGDWTGSMEELLEIIMRDKKWNDEAARKTYVAILELLTPAATQTTAGAQKDAGTIELSGATVQEQTPQAELLSTWRRKLSMALN